MYKMKKKLSIEGMSCKHCVMHVKEALSGLEGAKHIKVDLSQNSAVLDVPDSITDDDIKNAVSDAGYKVTQIYVL